MIAPRGTGLCACLSGQGRRQSTRVSSRSQGRRACADPPCAHRQWQGVHRLAVWPALPHGHGQPRLRSARRHAAARPLPQRRGAEAGHFALQRALERPAAATSPQRPSARWRLQGGAPPKAGVVQAAAAGCVREELSATPIHAVRMGRCSSGHNLSGHPTAQQRGRGPALDHAGRCSPPARCWALRVPGSCPLMPVLHLGAADAEGTGRAVLPDPPDRRQARILERWARARSGPFIGIWPQCQP